jgi:hypothetical protein
VCARAAQRRQAGGGVGGSDHGIPRRSDAARERRARPLDSARVPLNHAEAPAAVPRLAQPGPAQALRFACKGTRSTHTGPLPSAAVPRLAQPHNQVRSGRVGCTDSLGISIRYLDCRMHSVRHSAAAAARPAASGAV